VFPVPSQLVGFELVREGTVRRLPPVLVDEAMFPFSQIALPDPFHLPIGEMHDPGRLLERQDPPPDPVKDHRPFPLDVAHVRSSFLNRGIVRGGKWSSKSHEAGFYSTIS
jgi:hypothetical protein